MRWRCGPDTINTLPIETLTAYRNQGHPKTTLEEDVFEADKVLDNLSLLGIDLAQSTQLLEEQGVQKFSTALDQLMVSLKKKQSAHFPAKAGKS